MVRGISREVLVAKSGETWSLQEHVGHLLDLEPLWAARVDDFLSDRETLTVADLGNRKTDEANHNAKELSQILAQFRAARLQLLDQLARLEPEFFSRSMLHPRLMQPMRLVDHLYFAAEHDDHHLAIVWEMIQSPHSAGAHTLC